MRDQVVMLKHQLLVGVPLLHLVHQFREVVIISLMCLTPSGYELDLLTTITTNAHSAGEIMGQILLVPLKS